MDFVDYCIATKNYSALSAVSEYSKLFSDEKTQKEEPKEFVINNREANEKWGRLYKNDLKRTTAQAASKATVFGVPALVAAGLIAANAHSHLHNAVVDDGDDD